MSERSTASEPPHIGAAMLEELAAFIDGRLEGAARARVIERLAEDEAFYEVYADTLRFVEVERAEEGAEGELIDLETARRRGAPWPILIAAVLAAVALGAVAWLRFQPVLDRPTDFVVAFEHGTGLEAVAPHVLDEIPRDWPRLRSGSQHAWPAGLPARAVDFQLGVHLVDLETALAAADAEQAAYHARKIAAILEHREDAFLGAHFQGIADDLEGGEEPASLRAISGPIGNALAEQGAAGKPDALALGLWAESCRLAALAGDEAYFHRGDVRRGLRRLGGKVEVSKAEPALAEIDRLLRDPSRVDLAALERACGKVVGAGGAR